MSNFTIMSCDIATGAYTAILPDWSSLDTSFEFSDVGAVRFDYPHDGLGFSSLMNDARLEVAVLLNGVEMDDARYRLQSVQGDEIKDDSLVTVNGASMLNRFKKAIVYSGDGSLTVAKSQTFLNATPGGILKALFDQNAARGVGTVCDEITYASFSNTLDSAGNAWALSYGSIAYEVGVNYLDIIRNMVDNGMIEVKMVGRDVRVYNAGGLGIDRTVISEPVVLQKGVDFSEAPITKTQEQIAGVALIQGDQEILRQEIDLSVVAAWGRDETYISQGGIADSTTLGIVAQGELERINGVRAERTRKIELGASKFTPYTDYRVSDYIFNNSGPGLERLRIRQLVLGANQDGLISASIVLNDKFLEREIAIARKVSGILGGANAGGSVAIPTPSPSEDTTVPNAPATLTATSYVYVNGIIDKTVTAAALSWPAVVQNTNGSTISDLSHYETQYKFDEVFTQHPALTITPGRDLDSYTKRFDRRGKGYGWLGGDSGASTRATSGKDFWAFADTNLGVADQEGRITGQWNFIHNSWVLTSDTDSSVFDAKWGFGNKMTQDDAFVKTTIGNWIAGANCTVTRGTTTGYYGTTNCIQATSLAPGDVTVAMASGAALYMAVVAGRTYSVMARARSVGTARTVALGIRWYDAGNNLLSTSTATNQTGTNSTWNRHVYFAVAPVNAVKAAPIVIFRAASSAQVFNTDAVQFSEGNALYYGWNDPGRALLGGPCAAIHPEELGGTPLADFNDIFWTDAAVTVSGKILVAYTRYNTTGTFKNEVHICQFDGTTHAFESITPWSTADTNNWWSAAVSDGTFLYAYGYAISAGDRLVHIMRVPIGNVLGGTKEWWNGTTWTTTRASSAVIYTGYSAQFGGVTQIGSTWYAVVTEYGGNTMKYLTAPAAQGPWTMQGNFYTQPEVGSGIVAYFPRIHRQLESNAGIPMSYSVNGSVNGVNSTGNIRYYAPKFLIGPPANIVPVEPVTDWSESRVIPSGTLIDTIGNIPPGANFRARVRALDSNGNASTWTLSTPIRTSLDTVAPNKPSTPIVAAQFQGVRIEWDGLDFQGGPPPGDWSYLEVHVSEVAAFQPGPLTKVDTIRTRAGGVYPYQGLVYGRTYYVRFISVDSKGNRSDPSDTASAAPEQLVDTNELGAKLISGAKIADQTIAVRSLTVASFDANIVPNGNMEEEATNADGSGTGKPYGWTDSGWTWGAGVTWAIDATGQMSGDKSLKVTVPTQNDGAMIRSVKFPVVGGKLLAVSGKVRANRATANNNVLAVQIATGVTEGDAGSFPGANSTWHPSTAVAGTAAVQTLENQVIVPATHRWATVFLVNYTALDASGYTAQWDDVSVRPVGGSAFIADLSVLNGKIANLAVNDAKIANLSVGKLTAGILSADMTVSSRIKTSDTGARVELNSAGLQAYNITGDRTVDVSSANGDATFTGKFKTGFTGARLEMTDLTDRTTLAFYPTTGTNIAFINSPTDVNGVPRLGMNSGQFTYNGTVSRHLLFLDNLNGIFLRTYRTSDFSTNGFALYLGPGSASILWAGTSAIAGGGLSMTTTEFDLKQATAGLYRGGRVYGDNESLWFQVYNSGENINVEIMMLDDGTISFIRGKFDNYVDWGTEHGIFTGRVGASAGTVWAFSYGVARVAAPATIVTPRFNTAIGWAVTAASTTGFTVSSTNTGAGDISFWNYRV